MVSLHPKERRILWLEETTMGHAHPGMEVLRLLQPVRLIKPGQLTFIGGYHFPVRSP